MAKRNGFVDKNLSYIFNEEPGEKNPMSTEIFNASVKFEQDGYNYHVTHGNSVMINVCNVY